MKSWVSSGLAFFVSFSILLQASHAGSITGTIEDEGSSPIPSLPVYRVFSSGFGWSQVGTTTDSSGVFTFTGVSEPVNYLRTMASSVYANEWLGTGGNVFSKNATAGTAPPDGALAILGADVGDVGGYTIQIAEGGVMTVTVEAEEDGSLLPNYPFGVYFNNTSGSFPSYQAAKFGFTGAAGEPFVVDQLWPGDDFYVGTFNEAVNRIDEFFPDQKFYGAFQDPPSGSVGLESDLGDSQSVTMSLSVGITETIQIIDDTTSMPVPGAKVEIRAENGGRVSSMATADSMGMATVTKIRPGPGYIFCDPTSVNDHMKEYYSVSSDSWALFLFQAPDFTADPVAFPDGSSPTIATDPFAQIQINVKTPMGTPIAFQNIQPVDDKGRFGSIAAANSSGDATLDVLPGLHYIKYNSPFFFSESVPEQWYNDVLPSGSGIPDGASCVSAPSPGSTTVITDTLVAGGAMTITATGDGLPVSFASVVIKNEQGDVQGSGFISSGMGLLEHVPVGVKTFEIVPSSGVNLLPEVFTQTIPLGGGVDVVVDLDVGGTVSGTLKENGGGGVESAYLDVFDDQGEEINTFVSTDADGNFVIQGLPTGNYTLNYQAPAEENHYLPSSVPFTATAGVGSDLGDVLLEQGGQLTASFVVSDTANPINLGTIFIADQNENIIRGPIFTDVSGRAKVVGIPANEPFSVYAFNNGNDPWSSAWAGKPGENPEDLAFVGLNPPAGAEVYTVTANGSLPGVVNILAPPAGVMSGTIQSARDGNPIQNLFVQVMNSDLKEIAYGVTDINGNYVSYAPKASGLFPRTADFFGSGYDQEYYNDVKYTDSEAPIPGGATPIDLSSSPVITSVNFSLDGGPSPNVSDLEVLSGVLMPSDTLTLGEDTRTVLVIVRNNGPHIASGEEFKVLMPNMLGEVIPVTPVDHVIPPSQSDEPRAELGELAVGVVQSPIAVVFTPVITGTLPLTAGFLAPSCDPNLLNNSSIMTITANAPLDSNMNGLPNSFESSTGISDPNDNSDLDDYTALEEYTLGDQFDPNVTDPAFTITDVGSGSFLMTFPTSNARLYDIEGNQNIPNDLGWTLITTVLGDGSVKTVSLDDSAPFNAFRVRVRVPGQ